MSVPVPSALGPENPTAVPVKKPVYKRWWFWIGVVLVLLVIANLGAKKSGETASVSVESSQPVAAVPTLIATPEIRIEETKPPVEASPEPTQEATPAEPEVPYEYKNALKKAISYSEMMHMSKQGIYDQLTSEYGEKFSADAAQYAVDNMVVDWNANALAKAKEYQELMSMSPEAIRDQLTSEYGERFTPEEADYAITHLND